MKVVKRLNVNTSAFTKSKIPAMLMLLLVVTDNNRFKAVKVSDELGACTRLTPVRTDWPLLQCINTVTVSLSALSSDHDDRWRQ